MTTSAKAAFLSLEDIYLFSRSGRVISRCSSSDAPISNVFDLISNEDRDFILEHSLVNEFIPFIITESKIGPMIIVRSFYPAFRLFLAIVPHFSGDEIYALAHRCIPAGVIASVSCADRFGAAFPDVSLTEDHFLFGKRISDAFLDVRLYRAQNMTNRQILERIASKIEAFSALFGFDNKLLFDSVTIDVEGKNRFSMESFLLTLLLVALLLRRCSDGPSVRIALLGHRLGLYCEMLFDPMGVDGLELSPELRALEAYTVAHYFEHVRYYREDGFFIQFCPWESDPSEVGLKADEKFDYSDGEEEKICPSLLGRR